MKAPKANFRFLAIMILWLTATISTVAQQNTVIQTQRDDQWAGLINTNGYVSIATTNSYNGALNNDIQLSFFTPAGFLANPVQIFSSGNGGILEARDMCEGPVSTSGNQTYYVTGVERVNANALGNLFLMNVDGNGIVNWSFSLANSGIQDQEGVAVVTMPNQDVMVTGRVTNMGTGNSVVYVARFNAAGIIQWGNSYGCTNELGSCMSCGVIVGSNAVQCDIVPREATYNAIVPPSSTVAACNNAPDGISITGRYSGVGAPVGSHAFIMTIDGNGNESWRAVFPTFANNNVQTEGFDIIQNMGNGGTLAVTGSAKFATGAQRIYTFESTPVGVVTWSKVSGLVNVNNAYGRAIEVDKNNQTAYVVAGPDFTNNNTFLLQVQPNTATNPCSASNPAREYPLSDAHPTAAEDIITTGGGYFITTSQLSTTTNYDMHELYTDFVGNTPTCPVTDVLVQVYCDPNSTILPRCQMPNAAWTPVPVISFTKFPTENYCTPACPITVSITPSNISCNGMINGSATAIVAGVPSTCPITYAWSNGATTSSISGLPVGVYCLTVTDCSGCTATACVTITQPPLLTVTAGANQIICKGSCAILNAVATGGTPTYVYTWSNGGTNPQTVCPTSTTTYTVTVTDSNGCTAAKTIKVTVKPKPVISGLANITICPCSSATLCATVTSGTAPYTYNWSNGATTNCNTVTPATTTTYTLTVTDAIGCVSTKSVTVTVKCSPPTNLTSTTTATTATFCWTPICPALSYQLQYRCAGGAWTSVTVAGTATCLTIAIPTTCPAGTIREWRIREKCCGGTWSLYSAIQLFVPTTLDNGDNSVDNSIDNIYNEETQWGVEALMLTPNPTNNQLSILLNEIKGETSVIISDMTGRTMEISSLDEDGFRKLDVSNYPAGLYIVTVRNGDNILSKKFMKQ